MFSTPWCYNEEEDEWKKKERTRETQKERKRQQQQTKSAESGQNYSKHVAKHTHLANERNAAFASCDDHVEAHFGGIIWASMRKCIGGSIKAAVSDHAYRWGMASVNVMGSRTFTWGTRYGTCGGILHVHRWPFLPPVIPPSC